ncbi:MAG: molecular chaperone GrpE [Candidatus Parcubacteria bacterium]|jgi:molecular chaperone GrpE
MVNKHNEEESTIQSDSDNLTYEDNSHPDTELVDDEATAEQKLKVLRTKLQEATDKNRELHEEVQRTKADFLNARKRLEDEVTRTRERDTVKHIEKLLPLADSFYLAMLDKSAWEKADEKWRKGIEGIKNQLDSILRGYEVAAVDPTGQTFDPIKHEALSTIPVTNESQHNQVITVMQLGYIRKSGDSEDIIRPARVTVGEYTA